MISTRENLLVRPWQQRKYDYHKKKISNATSVIDTKSPPHRGHVAVKLKKLQKENERSQKIERDNLILLQKLNHIMTTHWLDNYLPPQPTFLSRIGVYRPVDSGIDMMDDFFDNDFDSQAIDEQTFETKPKCRKLKCMACSPHKYVETVLIPEERIPWEPQKKEIGKRRSISVPPKRTAVPLPVIIEKPKSASTCEKTTKEHQERARTAGKLSANFLNKSTNSISISRGSLKLSVNFPPDAAVKFDKKSSGQNILKCRCSRNL
ncbi:unnamed protein product [Ceutorhynchus assimilis]|uniref:Uncharacterized protein n=1 Tax=Ceutorhynchus assimilis TaxID=467358 RepID=A0A9N9QLP4_9CUCU|nr:unnamed protein product [Ceutorhynchus assimilis]